MPFTCQICGAEFEDKKHKDRTCCSNHCAGVMSSRKRIRITLGDLKPVEGQAKRCSHCKYVVPISEFSVDLSKPDGVSRTCRPCVSKLAKEARRRVIENNQKLKAIGKKIPAPENKFCWRCQIIKTIDNFGRDSGRPDGRNPTCKTCASELQNISYYSDLKKTHQIDKDRRIKNPERRREISRSYRRRHPDEIKAKERLYAKQNPEKIRAKAHRRRAKKRQKPQRFTGSDWSRCLEYWNHCCAYCGHQQGLLEYTKITGDHWIPLIDPLCPGTIPENMIPACLSCNSRKQDRPPHDWVVMVYGKKRGRLIEKQIIEYFSWIKSQTASAETSVTSTVASAINSE